MDRPVLEKLDISRIFKIFPKLSSQNMLGALEFFFGRRRGSSRDLIHSFGSVRWERLGL